MTRPKTDTSVKHLVGKLNVDESVTLPTDNLQSVMVQVSQLKKQEEHKEKRFKCKLGLGDLVTVTRVQ